MGEGGGGHIGHKYLHGLFCPLFKNAANFI